MVHFSSVAPRNDRGCRQSWMQPVLVASRTILCPVAHSMNAPCPPRTHSQGQKQPRSPQSGTSTTTETSHLRPAQSSKRRSAPIEASLDERASARSQAGPPWGHPVVLGAVASQVSSLAELPDLGTCHGRHFSVRGVSGGRVPARRGSCCWYVPCNTRSARHEILPSTNLRRASPRGLL